MKLEGKVALVTGGGTGIGAAIAERFVKEGAKVMITGRRREMLEETSQKISSDRLALFCGDVSNRQDVEEMVKRTIAFGGKIDVLVNNAAISGQGAVADLDPEEWRRILDVNVTGPFLLMRETIPHMIKIGGGSIINISSVGGVVCLPGMPAYCTSKAALIMLTKQVALDYGRFGIRCNVVCPGGVKTSMTEKDFGQFGKMIGMDTDSFFALISKELPLRRFAAPHEIGGICTYLASEDSSFMTGSVILIDGGTSVVDVVGASITAALRRAGIVKD